MKLRARLKDCGRWCFLVRQAGELALGSIYRQGADVLTPSEATATTAILETSGYEVERIG